MPDTSTIDLLTKCLEVLPTLMDAAEAEPVLQRWDISADRWVPEDHDDDRRAVSAVCLVKRAEVAQLCDEIVSVITDVRHGPQVPDSIDPGPGTGFGPVGGGPRHAPRT